MTAKQRPARKPANDTAKGKQTVRKSSVFQADVPRHTIHEALRIPQAIADEYASAPTKPLNIAAAVELSLNSSQFRMLIGASAAYGLTIGAWNSDCIALTPLGKQAVSGKNDQEKNSAVKEAFLKPRVVGAFLSKYANNRMPKESTAKAVLVELGVPADSADHT